MKSLGLARRLLGIRLAALAERAGLSVREVARIERGDVLPKPATLAALDAAFVAIVLARLGQEGATS